MLVFPIAYGVFDSLGPWLKETVGFGWPSALGTGVYQAAYLYCMLGIAIGVYGSFVVCITLSFFLSFNIKREQSLILGIIG